MSPFVRPKPTAILLATAALFPLTAFAHEAPAADTPSGPQSSSIGTGAKDQGEEIVVTARRRTETSQEVPLAISVVGGEHIDNTGSFNVGRLQQLTPTLQYYSSNPRNTSLTIRGIGAPFGLTNDGFDQGVGIFSTTSIIRGSPPPPSTFSTSPRSRCCAGRRARFMARTPPPARSTSPAASRLSSSRAAPKRPSATSASSRSRRPSRVR